VRLLKQHRSCQVGERDGESLAEREEYVFSRPDGRPIHPDYFSQTFDRTVKRLGLPRIRLHDLRHTHATLGLAEE
jgi:integrase